MAGLISHSELWAKFSDEWRACLDNYPRIGYFKMNEAAGLGGEFRRFTKLQRDNKLRELARIINRHVRAVTFSCIDLDAHADTWAKHLPKPNNEEYFWPYQNTIMATCFELWDIGWKERFEIIFDEQVIFGPRARVWYPLVQDIAKHREPEAATILPMDPMFKDDKDFLPLQAADLFAWCMRRGTDAPDNTPFTWLLDELKAVSLSNYSQYYDRARMNAVLDETRRILREGSVPPALLEKYRDIMTLKRKR